MPIKINPICTYGIDDEMMVIGFCFSCDDIPLLALHDPHTCVHNMLPMNKNAIDVPYNCLLNLSPHRVIHNNYSFMMDDSYTMHQISLSNAYLVALVDYLTND